MPARSAAEKRSPNAASRLLSATRRPRRSRRAASAPEIRPSRTATGRDRHGTRNASRRTPSHSNWWRKDFQGDVILSLSLGRSNPRCFRGSSAVEFVDLKAFKFTLAHAAAAAFRNCEIRPFCLYGQHLPQSHGSWTFPPFARQSQGHRSRRGRRARGARSAAQRACDRCLPQSRSRYLEVSQSTAHRHAGRSRDAHFCHDRLAFGDDPPPLPTECGENLSPPRIRGTGRHALARSARPDRDGPGGLSGVRGQH